MAVTAILPILDVVQLITSATSRLTGGVPSHAVATDVLSAAERWRKRNLEDRLEPLQELATSQAEKGSASRRDVALALREFALSIVPLANPHQQGLLNSLSAELQGVLQESDPTEPVSGVFRLRTGRSERDARARVDRNVREAFFVSIGGALHDTNNTLTVLGLTVATAKKKIRDFPDAPALNEIILDIEHQIDVIATLIKQMRGQIDSQRDDYGGDPADLKTLLFSEGHVHQVFTKLAKLLHPLGRLQRTLRLRPRDGEGGGVVWSVLESVGTSIDLTKLSATLFRRLLRLQDLCEQTECPFSINPHAYLREDMIQAILGKGIRLRMDLDPSPWTVRGPSIRIWQVIINLVGNARQAMEDFGSMEISTRRVSLTAEEAESLPHDSASCSPRAGDYMQLTIRDAGPGIPAGLMGRIFDLFYSGRNSSGYGLAVTRELVEDMGGFLGIDSETEGEGHGTAFHIYLPRAS
ncbi:MAG TPA: ATP-binding protein [bacterium]|nr:ATP-binding protein [bacterium]